MAKGADTLEFTPEQLQQHPDAMLLLTLLGGLMCAIIVGSLAMTIYAAVHVSKGKAILRVEPWTPRVWGLVDLIILAVLLYLGQGVSVIALQLSGIDLKQLKQEGDFPLWAMAMLSLNYIAVMLLTLGWLYLRYGVSMTHVGFTIHKFRKHIAIGVGAALLSLPWVYLVMGLVSAGLKEEYDHPLLDRMTEEGTLSAFLLGVFCAVIAAPLTEEFLFRVMLQGWLQSIPFSRKHLWWFIGASQRERQKIDAVEAFVLDEHAPHDAPRSIPAETAESPSNPYSPPVPLATVVSGDVTPDSVSAADASPPLAVAPPVWPVFVSGTLFGLAHLGYGLSFVPLILLGIILGFLYRATHSIWPSVVVHFILNFISIISLGILTYVKSVVQ
ncbi:MAG: lysostaphin resistance A-like protein [Aureliella sp.]